MQSNCLGCHCLRWQYKTVKLWGEGAITWKPSIWGPLPRGNFPGDNCLGVIISCQLFCGTIVWVPIVQGIFIWGNYQGGNFLGRIIWGAIAFSPSLKKCVLLLWFKIVTYNPRQNIWSIIEKSRKIGQSKKSFISTFERF